MEILAAALTGSALSTEASAFGSDEGGPPHVGQFLIAIDPGHFAADRFCEAMDDLVASHVAAGVRLPGHSGRKQPVFIDADLWKKAVSLSEAKDGRNSC